jgi:hypothetical protein
VLRRVNVIYHRVKAAGENCSTVRDSGEPGADYQGYNFHLTRGAVIRAASICRPVLPAVLATKAKCVICRRNRLALSQTSLY